MEETNTFRTTSEYEGKRLDQFLSEQYEEHSRSFLKKLIDDGSVWVNGKNTKAGYKLREDDEITIRLPELEETDVIAQDIPFDVVYEDPHLLVVNKPKAMVVHPGHGNPSGTLVNALLHQVKDLSGINGVKRPGIVHRIDKDTSGLLLVAKNDEAHRGLAAQLKKHEIRRTYLALVEGVVTEDGGRIDAPIGRDPKNRIKMAVTDRNSKKAVTHFTVKRRYAKHTLIEANLETGRTHQIRVHMAYIGHPLVGDTVYGRKKQALTQEGQMLHAYRLAFTHPIKKEDLSFQIPLPVYFVKVLRKLARR
ncbi:RluA family pseudouridine synthase [Alkalibacter rhizosphaerae]|uniref:Pseudouridine synthase n=1 Tax=Alkalibacter rhizosphaerae TaxID=2815577 RepID=A0A974XFA3_9FIRM|nr:RluA family pseudouridine synthase [Alkalibacter rhizosphaerae]QSX08758.1 RluA family pseudouridine synthase [Alkalibacter rhizosphaerae]